MKYLLTCVLALVSLTAVAAEKCRLSTLDGTWEYIGAPSDLTRLPGGVVMSTAQGTMQVAGGEVVGGTLGQMLIMADGSVTVIPASISSGTMQLDTATCRIRAEIDSGLTIKGISVPANFVGRGEYSRIARAIVGRARSLLTGATSTFILRRP